MDNLIMLVIHYIFRRR